MDYAQNLRDLANYLVELPEEKTIKMDLYGGIVEASIWWFHQHLLSEKINCCTVACVLGYAPTIFEIKESHFSDGAFKYPLFCKEYFLPSLVMYLSIESNKNFEFLFGSLYDQLELSSHEHALQFQKRVEIYIENDCQAPDDFDTYKTY